MKTNLFTWSFIILLMVAFVSCKKEVSNTTGRNYNDPKHGGFENHPEYEQETGPGLVFIEGGSYAMGRTEQDVIFDWNNAPRRVTVSSFYMDETEIRNIDYLEYLYWLRYVYGQEKYFIYNEALPDTLVWRQRLAFNEPMVELYLRHPAYEDYPVVGVSWVQASKYSDWRTDRVNEVILVREGIFVDNLVPRQGVNQFNLDSYLFSSSSYDITLELPVSKDNKNKGNTNHDGKVDNLYRPADYFDTDNKNKQQQNVTETRRNVRTEDGIFLPRYRLPTEAEWEFAALAHIGNTYNERIYNRRLYPWNGHYIRNDSRKGDERGQIMANSMRGRGDNMGVAGALNDKADISAPVKSYWPNEYGLYCMAGNVNEWVMDVYRDMTYDDMEEFRPYRGNVYDDYNITIDPENGEVTLTPEASNYFNYVGQIQRKPVSDEACFNRENYTTADNRNYLDGDLESLIPGGAANYWNSTVDYKPDTLKVHNPIDSIDLTKLPKGSSYRKTGNDIEIFLPNKIVIRVDQNNVPTYTLPNGYRITQDSGKQVVILPDGSKVLPGGVIEFTDGERLLPRDIFAYTGYMYKDGNWGRDGEWGAGQYDKMNPKGNKGDNMKSLTTDRSRVFKGGSWNDRAYWMVPANRRFLDEKMARADLGFRCAMVRVGSPVQGKK
ncbi:MAG TPA: SUMF1/EgtB/PvdO family nonheme iron enzyme [Bacteroidales bacterium]|nr:SUMF1/EgtB/PvdO family nonheme iron enzyme [Bacteroidales bacterium]